MSILWEVSEKVMATHSRTLAWKIPWMEEPGGLQSMGSRRVRHDWVTSLSLFTFMHWKRKWQPTPVFLPGESQGWGSVVGCHLWGCTESDMTEATLQHDRYTNTIGNLSYSEKTLISKNTPYKMMKYKVTWIKRLWHWPVHRSVE